VGLAARHLEANGIPTVILGTARDIVEQCGVPRFLFTDFPLGNPAGRPYDVEMQAAILEMAFVLLESARYPRTTVQTPFHWPTDEWRHRYMLVDDANRDLLRAMGEERRTTRAARKAAP
jgi:D-proline reductase (dithiol) PrdB